MNGAGFCTSRNPILHVWELKIKENFLGPPGCELSKGESGSRNGVARVCKVKYETPG